LGIIENPKSLAFTKQIYIYRLALDRALWAEQLLSLLVFALSPGDIESALEFSVLLLDLTDPREPDFPLLQGHFALGQALKVPDGTAQVVQARREP
jgi:hypothetical protein